MLGMSSWDTVVAEAPELAAFVRQRIEDHGLALLATFLLTRGMLPAIGVAGAWLLAASITPTDAGLGAPTVLNPVVPTRIRRGLNVESGLNDGLATPIVMLALATLVTDQGETEASILQVGVVPVVLAVVCATVVALLSAWAMDRSRERHWSTHRGRALATAAVPLLLFGLAEIVGANVFITAFVAGLVFGAASTTLAEEHETSDVIEIAVDLLGFVVWFFAGGILFSVRVMKMPTMETPSPSVESSSGSATASLRTCASSPSARRLSSAIGMVSPRAIAATIAAT